MLLKNSTMLKRSCLCRDVRHLVIVIKYQKHGRDLSELPIFTRHLEKFGLEREWDQIFMEAQVSVWLLSNSIDALSFQPFKGGPAVASVGPHYTFVGGQLLPNNPVSSKLQINH